MTAIEFKNVSKVYQDGSKKKEALQATDFIVAKGEFVAIIGPSGSGKSTFLTLAGGLQKPSSGEIWINEQPFSEVSEKKRAKLRFKEIGFILQASNLVPFLRVSDQLRLVDKINKNSNKNYRNKLFKELDIEDLKGKYPENLSGGERQRVAIARALYNDPTIILADEPTASLDTNRAFDVVEILAKEAKELNKAIIMVTHDKRLVKYCDRVLEMHDGKLEEDSSHQRSK